jgi:hypothetical protein
VWANVLNNTLQTHLWHRSPLGWVRISSFPRLPWANITSKVWCVQKTPPGQRPTAGRPFLCNLFETDWWEITLGEKCGKDLQHPLAHRRRGCTAPQSTLHTPKIGGGLKTTSRTWKRQFDHNTSPNRDFKVDTWDSRQSTTFSKWGILAGTRGKGRAAGDHPTRYH